MKRYIEFLAFILLLTVSSYYLAQKYLFVNFSARNLVSRIVPPNKDVKQFLPQTSENSTQFTIPNGMNLGIFADLKGDLPRVLAFDTGGTLLTSIPASGKILALPDEDGNGVVDKIVTVLSSLNKPHGIVVDGNYLYVAETNAVSRYSYDSTTLTAAGREQLFTLPGGGRHFSRTIKINANKLYTSVGSSCDVCDEDNTNRAAILVSNLDGSDLKVLAKGLRNTVFFTFDKQGNIWGNDMGRDFLGDNLPPDEINFIDVKASNLPLNYGWPYCYGKGIRDNKYKSGQVSTYCTSTLNSKYDYPAHVAPLGITFDREGNLLAAFHGSWNSSTPVGYKIVKMSIFAGDVGGMTDYVKGFVRGKDEILGRPVDLIYDDNDNLFISDDHTGIIYVLYD